MQFIYFIYFYFFRKPIEKSNKLSHWTRREETHIFCTFPSLGDWRLSAKWGKLRAPLKPLSSIECSDGPGGLRGCPELDTHNCLPTPASRTVVRVIAAISPVLDDSIEWLSL